MLQCLTSGVGKPFGYHGIGGWSAEQINCVLPLVFPTLWLCSFSLIDQVKDLLLCEMKATLGGTAGSNFDDYDKDLLLGHIKNGWLLCIGVTN